MPMIETRDGTRLYVKSWGDGRPVVLIHGWPLSGDSWDPVTHALAEAGFQAIAYDRRGFGRSDQPSGGYDYDTFADDLAAVIDQCAGGEAALVGFSMGGGEVARYLSRHGGRGVAKVVLVSSVVPRLTKADDNPHGLDPAVLDKMTDGLLDDRAHFLHGFFRQFYGIGLLEKPVSSEVVDHSLAMAMQAGLRPTLLAAQAFATTDFRPDLAHFTVPTLVIHGTSDAIVPIDATAREVTKALPEAQSIEYLGAPHGVLAAQPDRLIADIIGFLNGEDVEAENAEAVREALMAEAILSRQPI